MANQPIDVTTLSVTDRVLAKFISAVGDDEALADSAGAMEELLLGDSSITNALLRKAMFGEDAE